MTEISFLWRVAGLSLRDNGGSLDCQSIAPKPSHQNQSPEKVQATFYMVSRCHQNIKASFILVAELVV